MLRGSTIVLSMGAIQVSALDPSLGIGGFGTQARSFLSNIGIGLVLQFLCPKVKYQGYELSGNYHSSSRSKLVCPKVPTHGTSGVLDIRVNFDFFIPELKP